MVRAYFLFKIVLFSLIMKVFQWLFYLKSLFSFLFKKIKYQVNSMLCGRFLKHNLKIVDDNGRILSDWEKIKNYIRGRPAVLCSCKRCGAQARVSTKLILLKKGALIL